MSKDGMGDDSVRLMSKGESTVAIVWLRQDLRLRDNPALQAAATHGGPIIPVYILCDAEEQEFPPGGASRWWLHRSLSALDAELRSRGSQLSLLRGPALDCLRAAVARTGARAVFWNRRYEPASVARDLEVKKELRADGLVVESYNGALLREPWAIQNGSGQPYRVYTPFKRRALEKLDPPAPLRAPSRWLAPPAWPDSVTLDELRLLPEIQWYDTMDETWARAKPARTRGCVRLPASRSPRTPRHAIDRTATARRRCRRICTSVKSQRARCGMRSPRRVRRWRTPPSPPSSSGASSRIT
jgi:deoxyribodipyrimidine photo-lyase